MNRGFFSVQSIRKKCMVFNMIFFNSLTVKVSTNLLLPAGNTFAVGVDINLQCEITGWPTPVVTWYKDDVELSPSDRIEITG